MSTDFHTALGISDAVDIADVNSRLSDLDAAITSQAAAAGGVSVAILYDAKATTTAGGSSSATTWNNRTLNTEVDPDGIVTISSSKFTPASGSYVILVQAAVNAGGDNRLRLYNVTGAASVKEGLNNAEISGAGVATLMWYFTANGTDEYRIDHYTTTAQATNGLGLAVSDGASEIYCQVMLIKVA